MPNVELSEEELAELAALRKSKAAPEQAPADTIPGIAAPGRPVVPPKAKRPADRAKPKLAAANRQAQASGYTLGKKKELGDEQDLELPSGATCRVRVIGPENLMTSGLLDQVDSLTAIVSGDLIAKAQTGRSQIDAASLAKDLGAIKQLMNKYDELTLMCVVEPQLHRPPEDPEDRIDGEAYIDQVSFEDKAFIVQFVMGGTQDLETFRAGSEEAVAGMAAVAGSADDGE